MLELGNGWRRLERRRVLLNLKTGNAVRGVLMTSKGGILELVDADLLAEGHADPIALDGSTVVSLDNVDFAQVLPPREIAPAAPPPTPEV